MSQIEHVTINFFLLQDRWQFANFSRDYRRDEKFLILEEDLKRHHGSITNLVMYFDSDKKYKINYRFDSSIIQMFSDPIEKQSKREVFIFYTYDNGYEWPLLSF